jgi:hypothetical protein
MPTRLRVEQCHTVLPTAASCTSHRDFYCFLSSLTNCFFQTYLHCCTERRSASCDTCAGSIGSPCLLARMARYRARKLLTRPQHPNWCICTPHHRCPRVSPLAPLRPSLIILTNAPSLAAAAIFMPGSPAPDLVMSTMGTFVILIFGTQRDILRAWATWFRLPSHLHPRTTVSVVSRRPSARAFPSPGGLTTSTSMLSPDPRAQFSTIASVDSVPTMEGIPPMRERDEKDPELGRPLSAV